MKKLNKKAKAMAAATTTTMTKAKVKGVAKTVEEKERPRALGNDACELCGGRGHWSRECPARIV